MLKRAVTEEAIAFWKEVDPDATEGLSDFQKSTIFDVVKRRGSDHHKADIRLSAFGYFLVVLFGRERRNPDRLKEERRQRPVLTFNNLVLLLVLWGSLIYTLYSLLPYAVELLLKIFL